MAALTIVAATAWGPSARAGSHVENQVTLNLQIVGLGGGECQIEVKPAHPGCQFPPVVRRIKTKPGTIVRSDVPMGVDLDPILARSTNPDRDCAFAITILEPGKPPKTYRRGIRLAKPVAGQPVPSQSLTCYITSPSQLARTEKDQPRR